MPESPCKTCTLKDEILAHLDGLNRTMDAKLSGINKEISGGFQSIRINIDKIENIQIKQWQKIADDSERIGVNSQRLSSFKWVIGILIMLQLTTLGFMVRLAMAR